MITIYAHENGSTRLVERVEPDWLRHDSGVWVWVDIINPDPGEVRILTDVFKFHELAIEDAIAEIHHPKIESYGDYLYVILHGIDFKAREHAFHTQDVDFFLSDRYLVTVHPGISRSIGKVGDICTRNSRVLGEGPAALMHRIIDTMVDNYRPEVEKLQERLDELEKEVFGRARANLARRIIDFKRDVASLRRVVLPERDVVGRLARREFPIISESLAYRYPGRLRPSGPFDRRVGLPSGPHLQPARGALVGGVESAQQRHEGADGDRDYLHAADGADWDVRNERPAAASAGWGEPAQFWWILFIMLAITGAMLYMFRRRGWL